MLLGQPYTMTIVSFSLHHVTFWFSWTWLVAHTFAIWY